MSKKQPVPVPATPAAPSALARTAEEMEAIFRRADNGDKSALPLVREYLTTPGAADRIGGNLARRVEEKVLDSMCGKGLAIREAISRKMATLRTELAGPEAPPLERLLAERVVVCWLHLHQLELVYAGKESMSLTLAQHYQKCIDRANKRYLTSLKALADVRKLGITLQLNIAKKQVNVAGGTAAMSA